MSNLRTKNGMTIESIVKSHLNNLLDNIKKEVIKEIPKIIKDEVNNKTNWDNIQEAMKTDPDLLQDPINDKYSKDSGMSVQKAIKLDSENIGITKKDNAINFYAGNVDTLLSLSGRILYFEFGTLSYSEVDKTSPLKEYSISDFTYWNNPYIKRSDNFYKLMNIFPLWGFKSEPGKGRFGIGFMVPAKGNTKPFEGIRPVRMYRNSMESIEQRIKQQLPNIISRASKKRIR